MFSISQYVQAALKRAVYEADEHGVIVARVPGGQGFFFRERRMDNGHRRKSDSASLFWGNKQAAWKPSRRLWRERRDLNPRSPA